MVLDTFLRYFISNFLSPVKYNFSSSKGAGEAIPDAGIECMACGMPIDMFGTDKQLFELHPYSIHGKLYNETCTNFEKMVKLYLIIFGRRLKMSAVVNHEDQVVSCK